MYRIVRKKSLNPTVTQMEIEAPLVARKARPGQFIILRVDEDGERIPLTVAGVNAEEGTVKIIFQIVGATTEKLNHKEEGESIQDFAGPLGRATETEGIRKVCIVGGGVGNMIDRVLHGYVIDFIYISLIRFPVFNAADIYVSVSVTVLVLLVLFFYREKDYDTGK